MSVITISRLMGSLGEEISAKVANQLGYRLVCRDLINQAARQSGASIAALAEIDELGLLGFQPSAQERRVYQQAIRKIMCEIAESGDVVIVGRGGQVILRDRSDTLHVRIVAPLELRIQRVADKQGIEPGAARAQVEASDRSHLNYLRRCHKINWNDPVLYDLILNTHHLHPDRGVEIICFALKERTSL
jgi:cytidylate kinase